MGRLRKKISFDLEFGNEEYLNFLKEKKGIQTGKCLNELLRFFAKKDSSSSIQSAQYELLTYCKFQLKKLYKQLDNCEPFEKRNIYDKMMDYSIIAKYLNNGSGLKQSDLLDLTSMKKIELADGYILVPNSLIILNLDEAHNCKNAIIVECKNSKKYNIPTFIYFTNSSSIDEFDKSDYQLIHQKCKQYYEDFTWVLANQVTPIFDPDDSMLLLNQDEWNSAPNIGYFLIYANNDPILGNPYSKNPYGIQLFRNS